MDSEPVNYDDRDSNAYPRKRGSLSPLPNPPPQQITHGPAPLGPTDDNAHIADTVSRKRRASSILSDASKLTSTKVIKLEDTSDSSESRSGSPETEILGVDQPGESNWFREGLRSELDDNERFLEQPELYDLVNAVARKYDLNAGFLHKSYRGQDQLSHYKSLWGNSVIDVPAKMAFRPAVAIASGARMASGNKTIAWGQENEYHANWLQVSFHSDTQIPKIMFRVCPPSVQGAKEDPEPTFVHIFATDLSRGVYEKIKLETGRDVHLTPSQKDPVRPWLLEKVQSGLTTATHFYLSCDNRDIRETDADSRKSKPVIHGKATKSELDLMAKEAMNHKKDQPLHEQFLGLIHGNRIHKMTLITGYDSEDKSTETPREAIFCKYFGLIMTLCNELGNLWAYRQQFPSISWKDAKFPFSELSPPRWTITKWLPRSATTSGAQTNMPPVAAEWEPINMPPVFPGPEEEAFLRGLAAVEKDPASKRAFVRKDVVSSFAGVKLGS